MNEALPLAGRVALVTGVSRRVGIGFATARRLAELGADLVVHSWHAYDAAQSHGGDVGGVDAVLGELRSLGHRVEHAELDFVDPAAPEAAIRAAVDAFGHVDVLIANHAYSVAAPLDKLEAPDIDRHLSVNVRGTLLLVKAFAAQHDGRAGGRVVLLTSGQHLGPMSGELAYAASKGALQQITTSLSATLIERGITVNTVNPGPTDTGWASDELKAKVAQHMPLGRWGEPDDAARLIGWLSTDEARWLTGQVIDSEGGFRRE